ncbi:MAG: Holliday junction resolvase RecU [Metamycoplasmataceae bacterium]
MKNRGMLLEKIINKTINSYKNNGTALFHKKNLDIKFERVDKELNVYNSVISKKSTVDYYGIYKGRFIAFEAKSTNKEYLSFSNFKEHQHNYLLEIEKYLGIAFYIILFKKTSEFFIIKASNINLQIKKSITKDFILNNGYYLEIIYPGYIDFLSFINKIK